MTRSASNCTRRRVFGVTVAAVLSLLLIHHYIFSVAEDEQSDDASQLVDLSNFMFLKNHKNCKELARQPTVIVAVHTAPVNFNKRTVIRETWGYKDPRSMLLFFMGFVESEELQYQIDVENDLFGDIIQGNFVDAYRNLTYKHVMVLKWFSYNCPDVPFLLKTDDDVFVNTPLLYEYLEKPSKESKPMHTSQLVYCNLSPVRTVWRNKNVKWFVTFEEYPGNDYPVFCQGPFVVYSADVVPQLYHEAQALPYFWIDDAFVTGIVTDKLNISVTSSARHYKNINEALNAKGSPFVFTSPNLDESKIRSLWKLTNENRTSTTNLILNSKLKKGS